MDLGVGVFKPSYPNCLWWWSLDGKSCGLGGFVSDADAGLVGVRWKVFVAVFVVGGGGGCVSWLFDDDDAGIGRSSQFHHHGNPLDRMSVSDSCVDFGVAFHSWWEYA